MDRLSISSERPEEVEADEADEEEGTVSSPAASPESHVPDRLIWIKGQPALVPGTCDIATEYPEASLEGPWEQWEEEEEEEKEKEKEEKEEENETTDPMPTLGSSRNSTEFNQVKTHQRPLQRARKRYKERTGNSPWEDRHSGADHHLSDLLSQGLQVVNSHDPDPNSSDCPPHVPGVERWNHPGEACSVGNEDPADGDQAPWSPLRYPSV